MYQTVKTKIYAGYKSPPQTVQVDVEIRHPQHLEGERDAIEWIFNALEFPVCFCGGLHDNPLAASRYWGSVLDVVENILAEEELIYTLEIEGTIITP